MTYAFIAAEYSMWWWSLMNFCSDIKFNQLNPILVTVTFNDALLNVRSCDENVTLNHLKL